MHPILLRVPADLYERLRIAAFKRRLSIPEIIRKAIKRELREGNNNE